MRLKLPPITIRDDDLYQLGSDYSGVTALQGYDLETEYCVLFPKGELLIKSGFVWDGPSGPAINTPATLMPSALHDCLYKMISESWLPDEARKPADYTYRDALKTWRVPLWRRSLHFKAVRVFGGFHT